MSGASSASRFQAPIQESLEFEWTLRLHLRPRDHLPCETITMRTRST